MMHDPYLVLGVSRDATPEVIRAAFRRAVRERHPDTSSGRVDHAAIKDLVEAYHLLIDPTARARHDAGVPRRPGPPASHVGARGGGRRTSRRPRCPGCSGTGHIRSVSICRACAGTGEVTVIDIDASRRLRCPRCGGNGSVSVSHACGECRGTGRGGPVRSS